MRKWLVILVFASLLATGGWNGDPAQTSVAPASKLPPMLRDVGIEQRVGEQLPLDVVLRDETGKDVKLGDYFGKRPVILTLVYYKCPTLCTLVLNDLARTMNVLSESAGKDFDVVTVSFSPAETAELANAKKRGYLRAYRRPTAEAGWHFLTGDEASIKKLTEAAGFKYVWDPKQQQFIHASGLMVATPGGKLARYFFGVEYSARDLKLALNEASEGKTRSVASKALAYCFIYDESAGRYSLAIMRLLRVAAGMMVVGLGVFGVVMVRRERRTEKAATQASPLQAGGGT